MKKSPVSKTSISFQEIKNLGADPRELEAFKQITQTNNQIPFSNIVKFCRLMKKFELEAFLLSRYVELTIGMLNEGANLHVNEDSAFRRACALGHTEVVKLLIDRDADIDHHGMEGLWYATIRGNVPLTKLLLENGVVIDETTRNYALTKECAPKIRKILTSWHLR